MKDARGLCKQAKETNASRAEQTMQILVEKDGMSSLYDTENEKKKPRKTWSINSQKASRSGTGVPGRMEDPSGPGWGGYQEAGKVGIRRGVGQATLAWR